jgi:L-ascorbate metabolism protein UlaG (beta-lactamase superfamily)
MLVDSLQWLGHSGFRIQSGGVTVYIDPYRVSGGPAADLILVTHGHYDHFSPQDIERLSGDHTWLVAPAAVAERARGRVTAIAPGQALELEPFPGIEVAAVAAYNTSKRDADGNAFHPRSAGCVGYDLNIRGERLYHAGDTDVIPEMDAVVGADVALLPVSGTYVMTPQEAAEAARRIQPRLAVPMHWGDLVGTRDDAVAFLRQAPVEAIILERAEV